MKNAKHENKRKVLALLWLIALSEWASAEELPELTAGAELNRPLHTLPPVVVTAEKRPKLIENVSISLSVIDKQGINNTSANKLADMQQLVPNFTVVQYGIWNQISIRGVGGGGRSIGFDTRVGVYLDGVYMGQVPALEASLLEIDQIEILRGPQGYLFGRNTVAGAVNITTRGPTQKFEGYYRTGLSNYDGRENFASISGPISDDILGKISIGAESHNGFVRNTFNGSDIRDLGRLSTRGQLSWRASDQLKIDFSGDYTRIHQSDFEGGAVTGLFDAPLARGADTRRAISFNDSPLVKDRLSGVNLTTNYDTTDGGKFTSITGYRSTFGNQRSDNDLSSVDLIHTDFLDKFRQFSEEVRFASSIANPFRYVAGLYYAYEHANSDRTAFIGNGVSTLITLPGVPDPTPFGLVFGIPAESRDPLLSSIKTNSYAAFASADYDFTDDLTFNAGVRYTYETKSLFYSIDGSQSGALGIATLSNYKNHRSDHDFSPTLGLSYAFSKDINVYGKYSRGFKSGGWNVDFLTGPQVSNDFSFNKETADSYEVGLKGSAFGHRMQYDLAVFLAKYKDFQVFQFVGLPSGQTVILLRNAARAESKGVEASVSALLSSRLTVGANLGLLDAKFKSFPGGGAGGRDAAGHRLPDAPKVTAAFTFDYAVPMESLGGKVDLYGESTFRSKSLSGINNDPSISGLTSRNIVNARLTFLSSSHRWQVSAWARNLFDRAYTTSHGRDFFGNRFLRYGDPRRFGLEVQINF